MPFRRITGLECTCANCGHLWRTCGKLPNICPKCKSKHWVTGRTSVAKIGKSRKRGK